MKAASEGQITIRTSRHPKRDAHQTVYISPVTCALIKPLTAFLREGLERGETCIVFTTRKNQAVINQALIDQQVDIVAAFKTRKYITLNVKRVLDVIKSAGDSQDGAYPIAIENVALLAAGKNGHIRVFGELITAE